MQMLLKQGLPVRQQSKQVQPQRLNSSSVPSEPANSPEKRGAR
jgi:hypothetical protein